jgi:hypothetical protein
VDIHWTVFDVAVRPQEGGLIIRFKEIGTQNKYVAHLSRKTAALLAEDLRRILSTEANEEPKTGQGKGQDPEGLR